MTGFLIRPVGIIITLFVLIFISSGCNDPSFVGEDLVEGDRIDFEVTEDFEISARVVKADSILTFERFDRLGAHRIGHYSHPFFGSIKAEFALHLVPQIPVVDTSETITIDSVILALHYNSSAFYGDTTVPMSIDVFRLNEFYDPRNPYYTNHIFNYDPMPVGQLLNFTPKPNTLITRITEGEDGSDTSQLVPQLRIPINNEIGMELLSLDSTSIQSDSLFLTQFNGLYLSTKGQAGSLMGFYPDNPRTQLIVYYTGDGEEQIRRYVPETQFLTAQVYNHSYESSGVEDLIDSEQDQTLIFQGLGGLASRINIEGIDELQGSLINQARLRIYLNELDEPTVGNEQTIPRLLMFKQNEDGSLSPIEDVRIEQGSSTTVNFGGFLEDKVIGNDTLSVYEMNITSHLQEVIRKGNNPALFLRANNTANLMGNSRTFGAGHDEFPIELRVIYTR